MDRRVYSYLKDYSFDPKIIDRLIISSFVYINNISIVNNKLINEYLIKDNDKFQKQEFESLNGFIELIKLERENLTFEDLIELFEFVVSPSDKEVNGAVYTPKYIREHIINDVIKKLSKRKVNRNLENLKFADISCGCSGFLYSIAKHLKQKFGKSYYDIFSQNIYGLDIKEFSVVRSKLLLSLLAITEGEDKIEFNFNLFIGNSLEFNWVENSPQIDKNNGFDAVIGNPPYVSSLKIDDESKMLLKNWSVSSTGKSDLYIPFFQIGIENLNEGGVLGYITVNSFYKSLNGRALRKYFSQERFNISILDFAGQQLFKGLSTYTCICIVEKNNNGKINFKEAENLVLTALKESDYLKIDYKELDNHKGWLLLDKQSRINIASIENAGDKLERKFEVRNGFATLRNDLYLFKPIAEEEDFYIIEKGGKQYKIEKSICRNAINSNTLRSIDEIEERKEKLIFPYSKDIKKLNLFGNESRPVNLISEQSFIQQFPNAYSYLSEHRNLLKNRDKGKKKYPQWFAFGRSQALTHYGYKLLFPYLADKPRFILSDEKALLFYSGYAIFSESLDELLVLQKILMSDIFWYYIKKTSKPYSGGYFSFAKNYVKNFSICDLTKDDKTFLLKTKNDTEINNFLKSKYNIKELWNS